MTLHSIANGIAPRYPEPDRPKPEYGSFEEMLAAMHDDAKAVRSRQKPQTQKCGRTKGQYSPLKEKRMKILRETLTCDFQTTQSLHQLTGIPLTNLSQCLQDLKRLGFSEFKRRGNQGSVWRKRPAPVKVAT